jgi:hypothetical protein
VVVDDLRTQGIISVRAIAAELNERGIPTPRGGSVRHYHCGARSTSPGFGSAIFNQHLRNGGLGCFSGRTGESRRLIYRSSALRSASVGGLQTRHQPSRRRWMA